MSAETVRCTSCGAPMKLHSADTRIAACGYCGQTAIDHHQIAHGLALNLADLDTFLDRLAERKTALYKKLVRGVALKSAPHPLDRWYGMLTTSRARFANENARVALTLRGG